MDDLSYQVLRLSRPIPVGLTSRNQSQASESVVVVGESHDDFGSHSDVAVRWQEERVFKDVVQGDSVGIMKVIYERHASFRYYASRQLLIATGLRRQYQKLLQACWPEVSRRPSFSEARFHLLRVVGNPNFQKYFRESLRDVVITELTVGRVRNATLRVPSTDVTAVLELADTHDRRLKKLSAQPRIDGVESLGLSSTGGIAIQSGMDDPFAALDAIVPTLLAVGLLEFADG